MVGRSRHRGRNGAARPEGLPPMYTLRHLGYVALTFARKAVKPSFWKHGKCLWLAWDALAWIGDAAWLVISSSRQVRCDCCGWCGHRFFLHTFVSGTTVHRFSGEICPRCEALGRQRQLVRYLDRRLAFFPLDTVRILDIGPGSADLRLFSERGLNGVLTMDLRVGAAMLAMDITRMGFGDSVFDVIVCSHVLEHVPDDRAALNDMRRVLKPEGVCVIQVPMKPGLDHTIEYGGPDSEEFDHFRAYGQDFTSRLTAAGFAISYSENELFEVKKWHS